MNIPVFGSKYLFLAQSIANKFIRVSCTLGFSISCRWMLATGMPVLSPGTVKDGQSTPKRQRLLYIPVSSVNFMFILRFSKSFQILLNNPRKKVFWYKPGCYDFKKSIFSRNKTHFLYLRLIHHILDLFTN